MKKIMIVSLCAFALSISGAAAKPKHHAKKHQSTTGMSSQSTIPGNPYAGGGPSGANQATNRPNASNEIGSGGGNR
ncbi:MAG: hypothetical protein ACRC9K_08580 [Afipia sp.]